MFIFEATIDWCEVDCYEAQGGVHWRGLFSTAQLAEQHIAVKQAEIAPEAAWVDDEVEVETKSKYPYRLRYEASIRKVGVTTTPPNAERSPCS